MRALHVAERVEQAEQFVIAPHHPDRLRRPAIAVWSASEIRRQQALLWNVFRTFELLPPAFWLRRLHARLFGATSTPAPQVVRVGLWESLPLPPAQLIDGARPNVTVDVLIETDRAVWSLIAPDDRFWGDESARVAAIIDAGAWFARSREHYCGVVETPADSGGVGSVLQQRYARSRESASLRSRQPGTPAPLSGGIGIVQPVDLVAILHECASDATLSPIERALADHALRWWESVQSS